VLVADCACLQPSGPQDEVDASATTLAFAGSSSWEPVCRQVAWVRLAAVSSLHCSIVSWKMDAVDRLILSGARSWTSLPQIALQRGQVPLLPTCLLLALLAAENSEIPSGCDSRSKIQVYCFDVCCSLHRGTEALLS
jgi:hypothetical protein